MIPYKRYYNLTKNEIIKISGKDKCNFLQGIISNDIKNVENGKPIYSSILSPQGRFLYDFFVIKNQDSFLLECRKVHSFEILKKFNMHKLRSDVNFELQNNFEILLLNIEDIDIVLESLKNKMHFSDPRFPKLLSRIYIKGSDFEKIINSSRLKEISNQDYKNFRLKYFIPDFTEDAEIGKSLLMEMRFDKLNGISWDKGCYMGQEVTARMKYRNIVKKQLFGVKINFNSFTDNDIKVEGESIGKLMSHNKEYGISFINLKKLDEFSFRKIYSGDSTINLEIPWWAKNSN
tara:strand:+ start:325 stop:1194 length:870 start_codon:yes stop_codon:yes gene_type:complete